MKVKDLWLGKIVVPLLLKTVSVREAYNCKKKKRKKKEKSTDLGTNGEKPQMYMQGYVEN